MPAGHGERDGVVHESLEDDGQQGRVPDDLGQRIDGHGVGREVVTGTHLLDHPGRDHLEVDGAPADRLLTEVRQQEDIRDQPVEAGEHPGGGRQPPVAGLGAAVADVLPGAGGANPQTSVSP